MSVSAIFLLVGILSSIQPAFSASKFIGVCYGVNGDNLPPRKEVVDLYKSNGIGKMRIYYPDEQVLQALRGSNIELIMDVAGDTLQSLADPSAATGWVNHYITPYSQEVNFKYIVVGNEIHPNYSVAKYILPVMTNIQNAISLTKLKIKVSTAIDSTLITDSYPPNNGVFATDASPYIGPIVKFLVNNRAPLLANVYPYFAYLNNQQDISLDYALFTQPGITNVGYQNMFDAMVDSIYAALEKMDASNLEIVVSESGWPSAGGVGGSVKYAQTYYTNLIGHVNSGSGTPKRPNRTIETFLFAMFDENQKPNAETERHLGLFNSDKSSKYEKIIFN